MSSNPRAKNPIIAVNKVEKKVERTPESVKEKKQAQFKPTLSPRGTLSMNGSCSSDASSGSSSSRASTGRMISRSSVPSVRLKKGVLSYGKMDKVRVNDDEDGGDGDVEGLVMKKRCGWVTSSTDPSYVSFHDEEWGVPVHDDNKLFELLSLSVALAERTWPTILNKRRTFREVFLEFDPVSVSKLNEKKICGPGTPGSGLLSEMKLRNILENARQVCKIKNEFGSFDKYIWGFINQKPIVNNIRYSRQVPAKNSKADVISKDMVRRGFRGVGPTVIYSFMQAAGLTNDHLITCFRFQECVALSEETVKAGHAIIDMDKSVNMGKLELTRAFDEICISSN